MSTDATLLIESDDPTTSKAVYPNWKYGDSWSKLEKLVAENYADSGKPIEGAPEGWETVEGQEHRVIVNYLPNATTLISREFYLQLAELQAENLHCKIHVHGLYSTRINFAMGFAACDVDVRTDAAMSTVILPNGKKAHLDEFDPVENEYWCRLIGMNYKDLQVPRNRCIWNMRSFSWMSKYFTENVKFNVTGFQHIDPEQPFLKRKENGRVFTKNKLIPLPTDRFYCNTCSLQTKCKLFRVGMVCSVPGSEPEDLIKLVGSRDPEKLRQSMSTMMEIEAHRIKEARQSETTAGKLDPEVTKMLDRIFIHARDLLKLTDPKLRPVGAPGLNPGEVVPSLTGTPAQVTAGVITYMKELGVPQEQISPQTVMDIMTSPGEDLKEKIESAVATLRALPSGS
jgi:hypothetical protein